MGMAVAMGVGGSSSSSVVSAAATIACLFPLAPPLFPVSISSLNLGLGRPLAFQQQLLLIQNNNNSNSKNSPFPPPHPLILRTKSTTTILSSPFPCTSRSRLFSSSPTAAPLHLKHQRLQIDDDDDDDEFQREVGDDAQEAAPCEPNVRAIIEEEEEDKPVVTSHEKEEVEENEKEMSRRIPSPPPPPPPKLSLSVKERKELASFAHSLGKKLKSQQVGKSGVTPSVATSFLETLEANELLKVCVYVVIFTLLTCYYFRRPALFWSSKQTNSQ